ncbi:MAG: hypothetical protein CBARDMAM_5908 [uncultured Caballeronia sp.]|nr:MAG: hypothetical protein CBARDMAM_5908 [uncultured Caballeronia sp.]
MERMSNGGRQMDRFRQIETFVKVAEAGSLAAAALEEGVSPVIWGGVLMRWRSVWASS